MTSSDSPYRLRIADLPQRKPTRFDLVPDEAMTAALIDGLDLVGLRKIRFKGTVETVGARDWRLNAILGATVIQPCVVTLEPVTTRIEEPVIRHYLAKMPEPEGEETEMPEDETVEPLPEVIDLADLLHEALALALPPYPRAEGATLEEANFTESGKTALTDDDLRPFAGLSNLRDKLANGSEDP